MKIEQLKELIEIIKNTNFDIPEKDAKIELNQDDVEQLKKLAEMFKKVNDPSGKAENIST